MLAGLLTHISTFFALNASLFRLIIEVFLVSNWHVRSKLLTDYYWVQHSYLYTDTFHSYFITECYYATWSHYIKKYFINFIEGVIPHVSEAPCGCTSFHEYVITINKLCVASAHMRNISFTAVLLDRTKCPLFNYPKLIYFYCPRSSYYQKQQKIFCLKFGLYF